MIGHRNTYCKCQCRHIISSKNKNTKIYVNLNNNFFEDLAYNFLYGGYTVYSNKFNNILGLFSNFKYLEEYDDTIFDYCIINKNNKDIKSNKYIIINSDISNENIENNNKFFYIINKNKNEKISKIIYYLITHCKQTKKIYNINKENYEPKLHEKIYYYVPDRGKIKGRILNIKKHPNRVIKYTMDDNNNYFRHELEIFDYNKHL
jgi:hypothetical protein